MSEEKPEYKVEPIPSFVGLDLSLTSTGFCLKQDRSICLDTIKTVPKDFPDDLARLIYIRDQLLIRIPESVKMVCVEDFFTPQNSFQIGAAISLAMLGTAVRLAMYESGIPFVIIAPSQIKKFATGKGVGPKSIVVREVYKRWNVDARDDNQADASVLAYLAEALVTPITDDTPKFQAEVIRTVLKDRPRYNIKPEKR